jgi:hypothetical protein
VVVDVTTVSRSTDSSQSSDRVWPAWGVPEAAVDAWVRLVMAVEHLSRSTACQVEPELWWSVREVDQVAAAEACGWCPVVELCQAYATVAGERFGVWGGTTPAEQRELTGRRR